MVKKTIVYTVTTEVTYRENDPGDWKRKVRAIRKDLKTVIQSHDGNKIRRIETIQE
mgnify:CR=1 FL=1